MSINALIAQGGRPIGADLPEIANMLQQRSQQTLQNNRLATQDQYAAEEHAQRVDGYNEEKKTRDAHTAFYDTKQMLALPDSQLATAIASHPPAAAALQQSGIDLSDPSHLPAARAYLQKVNQITGERIGIAPPKPQEISPGASLVQPGQNPGDPYTTLFTAPKEVDPLAQGRLTEEVRHNKVDEAHAAAALRSSDAARAGGGAPPSGYRLAKDGSGDLEVIPGGPADKAGLGAREGVMFQRVLSSANAGLNDLKNISELPVGASSGVFGIGSSPGHSVMASARDALRNKLSGQEVQDYNTMIAGLSRNLSTIETAGLAPNGSITASMDSIMLRDGDSGTTKLRKLAQGRQIIERGLETNLANPKLPQAQKDIVKTILDGVGKAIPFTQHDITMLQQRQAKDPSVTLQDLANEKGLGKGGSAPAVVKSDADYAKLASGATYTAPDGSTRTKR